MSRASHPANVDSCTKTGRERVQKPTFALGVGSGEGEGWGYWVRSESTVMSGRAPTRTGGPQNPAPRVT